MARRPRRTHSPKLKAKVALAAIVGDKTIAELAVLHDVHPNQITEWKRQLVDRAPDVFGGEPNTPPVDLKVLHARLVNWHWRMIFWKARLAKRDC